MEFNYFLDEATGISDAARLNDKGQMMNDKLYNLKGQRVNDSYKGIVITNGRKLVIK